ncbi:MAG: UDP-N-acetylmuramoyl-L-alanine--D-glutamate ligase [Caldicoprobacterales bacterium]|jgi:UDP-N-acetylmuramoylalanine--D-glutamate ligase|nr:UDP-N-acetylmuramoyl-L-alanine--D-glutamate ligase [Clostridiales bacterium]
MDVRGKTVLVVGLARSGIAAARLLHKKGANVIINEQRKESEVSSAAEELKEDIDCEFYLGQDPDGVLDRVDQIVLSPGVPTDARFLIKAADMGIEVISEVELAYRYCKAPIVAVTGTNGKTTTTAWIGEILKASGTATHVAGNIGIPFTGKVEEIDAADQVVVEISSFQLETIVQFRPRVSLILNISEDHLDRHKTMDQYIAAKCRIFQNQGRGDYLVLNGDDPVLSSIQPQNEVRVFYFSRTQTLSEGAWVENGRIYMNIGAGAVPVCEISQVGIPGTHNLENALAAVLAAGLSGVEPHTIARVLREFPGVAHRIEKVDTINDITFYNDSKGTNPDSSIRAIQAIPGPIVLIAGGYDKKGSFSEFINAFGSKVKELVLLGETAEIIAQTAKEKGFAKIHMTRSIEEAVEKAYELSSPGYQVLLSPACASWDMFRDFEERGDRFKAAVKALRRQAW